MGLMIRMTNPLFGKGEAVVLESGFCVDKSITELETNGVYMVALIKKRRCWPKGVTGGIIDTHFQDKVVGNVEMTEART